MGDAVAVVDGKGSIRVVGHGNLQLAPVVAVNDPHAVGEGDAVFAGKTAAGVDKAYGPGL